MSEKYELDLRKGKIKIDFTDKPLTSYGGLSLLAAFFDKLNFREFIENLFPLNETSNNRRPIFSRIISFIITIILGGNRFSHILFLGDSTSIKEIFNIKRLPKASTTLTRLFGKLTTLKLSILISDKIWNYQKIILPLKKIKEDFLSFDSSVIVKYGKQEGAKKGYNPKKPRRNCWNSLIGFLNSNRYILNIWNHSGDSSSANNIINFFNEMYENVEEEIKILGILADSGFYKKKLILHLENLKLNYIIKTVLTSTLKNKILSLNKSYWKKIEAEIEIAEFKFKPTAWAKKRRYVVIRQNSKIKDDAIGKPIPLFEDIDMNKYKYSAMVTNYKIKEKKSFRNLENNKKKI